MSSTTIFRVARRVVANSRPRVASANLTTRLYSSSMHDNDPHILESEKQKNLTGQQHKTSAPHAHAPGWNEYLASASEAAIKADASGSDTPEILQRRTVEQVRARHHADDALESTEAVYERDEVEGPIKSKGN